LSERRKNFSSFGFLSVGFVCRQKPKVLKYAAGFRMKHNANINSVLIDFIVR